VIKRRNHGRGHSYYADRMPGRPPEELVRLPGVTTVLPPPNLKRWATELTANYAVDHWSRLGKMPVSARLKELYGVPGKHVGALSNRGTEVHRIAEQIVQGRSVVVPDDLRGHVESYRDFLAAFGLDAIAVELVIANRTVGYCGTADVVGHMLGQVWLLDLKTSESGIYPDAALQACGYEHGEVYAFPGEEDAEHPLADLGIERCGAIHVRSDGYDLRPLDTGPEVWDYFCRLVSNHAVKDDMREWVGEAVEPMRAMSLCHSPPGAS
jgi:hypothetical protein